jgi:hypothetical protein
VYRLAPQFEAPVAGAPVLADLYSLVHSSRDCPEARPVAASCSVKQGLVAPVELILAQSAVPTTARLRNSQETSCHARNGLIHIGSFALHAVTGT